MKPRVDADIETLVSEGHAERMTAPEVVAYVLERFHPRLTLACSFQKEDSVLLDMLLEREPGARVIALDTHVLVPETYALWRRVERRYGTSIEVYEGPSLGRQAAAHGDALWSSNPNLCCTIRKVEPLARALTDVDCWVTGIRRDQSETRARAPKLGWDDRHEIWKANPLADWSEEDVWTYVRERDLPVHELHGRGYASIGCTHCTQPGAGREGRWAGAEKTECGLHPA
jgi:phosphoadenosine phosphosulfate reductase